MLSKYEKEQVISFTRIVFPSPYRNEECLKFLLAFPRKLPRARSVVAAPMKLSGTSVMDANNAARCFCDAETTAVVEDPLEVYRSEVFDTINDDKVFVERGAPRKILSRGVSKFPRREDKICFPANRALDRQEVCQVQSRSCTRYLGT